MTLQSDLPASGCRGQDQGHHWIQPGREDARCWETGVQSSRLQVSKKKRRRESICSYKNLQHVFSFHQRRHVKGIILYYFVFFVVSGVMVILSKKRKRENNAQNRQEISSRFREWKDNWSGFKVSAESKKEGGFRPKANLQFSKKWADTSVHLSRENFNTIWSENQCLIV